MAQVVQILPYEIHWTRLSNKVNAIADDQLTAEKSHHLHAFLRVHRLAQFWVLKVGFDFLNMAYSWDLSSLHMRNKCLPHGKYYKGIAIEYISIPDSNVHGANMGPTWVLSAPDGPHIGPMNLAIKVSTLLNLNICEISPLYAINYRVYFMIQTVLRIEILVDLLRYQDETRYDMMTSSKGNIFRVTGPLCKEFTGHRWIPHTKASHAELWCFLWSAPEYTVD